MSARAAEVGQERSRARSRRHLGVARRRSGRLLVRGDSRRAAPLVVASILVAAVMITGVVLEQVLMAQSAFKLTESRARLAEAESRHEDLVLEATRLENPSRIEVFARDRLGMVDPNPLLTQYLVADIDLDDDARLAGRGPSRLSTTGAAAVETPGNGP